MAPAISLTASQRDQLHTFIHEKEHTGRVRLALPVRRVRVRRIHVDFHPGQSMESLMLWAVFLFPVVLGLAAVVGDYFGDHSLAKSTQENLDENVEKVRQRESLVGKLVVGVGLLLLGSFVLFMFWGIGIVGLSIGASFLALLIWGVGALGALIFGDFTIHYQAAVIAAAILYVLCIPVTAVVMSGWLE